MSVSNGVSRACLYTVPAEDAPVVIDVVHRRIAFAAAESLLFRVFGRFDIDTVCRAGSRTQEAGDALLKAIFVALQHVSASESLLKIGWPVGILFRDGGLQHLLEGDAHSLGDRRRRANHLANIRHFSSRLAQWRFSFVSPGLLERTSGKW